MAAARRALLLRLDADDGQRLEILATRRRVSPEELAELIVTSWIAGPGHHELVDALLRPRRTTKPRGRTVTTGQLSLVD